MRNSQRQLCFPSLRIYAHLACKETKGHSHNFALNKTMDLLELTI